MTRALKLSAGSAARHSRSDRGDAALRARLRRSAWLFGALAAAFYVGYLAWAVVRAMS
jgi:fucose permease